MHFGRSPSYEGGQQTQWFTRNNKNATANYGAIMQPIVDRCVRVSHPYPYPFTYPYPSPYPYPYP